MPVKAPRANYGVMQGAMNRVRSGTALYDNCGLDDNDYETGHNVVIREECVIGTGLRIWSNSVIDYGCTIGDRVKIHCNCYIAQKTVIEADVFIGPGVTITNDRFPPRTEEHWEPVTLKKGCRIGGGAVILPGVTVGAGALVGAGAVVTKDVPPGGTVYGNPARAAFPKSGGGTRGVGNVFPEHEGLT